MPSRPAPITRAYPVGGPDNAIDLAVHEWPGADPAKPPLVFAHATGFHGRMFDAIIERFPAHPAFAMDLRGHGQSGGGPIDDWRQVAVDVAGFLAVAGISGAIGIGHSMGAHTLLQVAADAPGAFSRLVLFDPVIFAPEFYALAERQFTPDNPHPTIRGKRDFASAAAMIDRFRTREPYSLFDPRVFADYCHFGLVPAPSGEGFELACTPEVEASVYASSHSNGAILDAGRKIDIPVLVVRAKHTGLADFKGSPTWPDLASILPQGADLYRPDRTHFHPFEDPGDAARIIAEFIA